MIDRQISHFRITEPIGAGGMGVVYKAVDLRLQRTVAIKLLPPDVGPDTERKRRFFHEAQAASALNHPNIVTVYEVDTADGVDFIAMEYVEGRSLDGIIGSQALPLPQALGYAIQIADALARAHAAGIVHRDLKPSNVIVTAEERVKVLDFGIAKRIGPDLTDAGPLLPTQDLALETQEGVVIGTPRYMSPEQVQGKKVDARSDIFSFGALLYEMLTGRRPFAGESLAELLSSILRDPPAPLSHLRPELPEEMVRIVGKALEKDPEYRHQHMQDVLADLRRLHRDSTTGTTVERPLPAPLRKKIPVAVSLVLAAVVLTLAVALWLRRGRSASPPSQFRLVSTFAGSHRSPSLSPDGRLMAFISEADGVPQVWVKYLEEGAPVQVTTGDAPASRPRWSPKGDTIIFERRRQGLWMVPPLGGQPRSIATEGSCPSFFPDGERVVFGRGADIWAARLDGSDARRLEGVPTSFYTAYTPRCPTVSPDGGTLVFFHPEAGPNGDLWLMPAGGGQARRLTFDSTEADGPVWTPDGRFIVFSSLRRGSRTLWRVSASGGEPEPLTTGAGDDTEPDISADGTKLIYTNTRIAYALLILDPKTGGQREVLERRSHINGPVFSPDGSRIALFALTERGEHLFTVRADGTELRQVTQVGGEKNIMPQWSADGSFLYHYGRLPSPSFRKIPAAGGPSTVVVDGWTWEAQNGARLDPSGRLLAYSVLEDGRPTATRVREIATGAERTLGRAFFSPKWSHDGTSLLGNDWDGGILICPADGSACRTIGQGRSASWSADGSWIFFQRGGRPIEDPSLRSINLWVMNRDGSDARQIAVLEPRLSLATAVSVSRSDQIAWVQVRRGRQELWLAELGR